MMEQRNTLGVIGGLGPIATAHFMELVIRMTEAATDQEHLDMILYNRPSIPDRTGYILDGEPDNSEVRSLIHHFQAEIDSFVNCIKTGEKLPSHNDKAIITATMMQAMYDSSEQGKEISLA